MKLKVILCCFFLLSTISCDNNQCGIKRCCDGHILNNIDCVCELKNSSCAPCLTSRFTQNPETCECSCDIKCDDGFDTIGELDYEQCDCFQKPCTSHIDCPEGYRIDYKNCSNICRNCSCVQVTLELNKIHERSNHDELVLSVNASSTNTCDSCPYNFTQDPDTCQCYCELKCLDTSDSIAIFDFDKCNCFHIKCNNTCPDGFIFDGEHCNSLCLDCRCIPDPFLDVTITDVACIGFDFDCADDYWFNPESCQCQIRCDEGLIFVNDECLQICEEFVECDDDSKWNRTACSCVCTPRDDCLSGQLFNQDNCQCEDVELAA